MDSSIGSEKADGSKDSAKASGFSHESNKDTNNNQIEIPQISLPKGGGAISGIGEKFSANPVTGTGSFSIPIAASPGRAGFGPQLSLSYDSGAGNGCFGMGWNLSLPTITRKTDKGLPYYLTGDQEDTFILSGAEDLVPVLKERDAIEKLIFSRVVNNQQYSITRYRPRIEGLFALIEYWVNSNDASDSFWRSISKENITTWYGKTEQSRISDPADPTRIFSWLICQSHDAKGNVIEYEYKAEDSSGVDAFQPHERHRSELSRSANRYIKSIKYGNQQPFFPQLSPNAPINQPSDKWFFELVFDYVAEREDIPILSGADSWGERADAFSNYRSGFEVRNYRLCHRILMFHHFEGDDIEEEEGVGENYLVRSTDIAYKSAADKQSYTQIESITHTSYRKKSDGRYSKRSMPPVSFSYSQAVVGNNVQTLSPDSLENLPQGVDGNQYRWVDLNGEGLTGVLTEQAGSWFYKTNESPVTRVKTLNEEEEQQNHFSAQLGASQTVARLPVGGLANGSKQLMDIDGNGQLDLVQFSAPMSGFFERNEIDSWENFSPFKQYPNINWQDPNLKFIDLTGDGHADAVITEADVITWYPSLAKQGFAESQRSHIASNEDDGARILFANAEETIFQSDLSGDGLTDIVRIRNGEICYWPNLGYGKFGKKITMGNAPWFDHSDQFSPQRIRLTDVDGSGTIDIIYLGRQQASIYFNQSGNTWSDANVITAYPHVDNLSSVNAVDLLGNGTACLVWSSPLANHQGSQIRYIELMAKGKPHLLVKTNNNMGAETHIQYLPSTYFYLKDKQAGKPWITRLPFPVHVVERVVVTDKWRKTRFASNYSYHHGYFDGQEREFRGFGRVEQVDTETFGTFTNANRNSPYISTEDQTLYQPPVKTITWYHTGAAIDRKKILSQYSKEYFPNNLAAGAIAADYQENTFPEPNLSHLLLNSDEWLEAMRACKGMPLRQEVYELDVKELEQGRHTPVKLFTTAYHNCEIRRVQPKSVNAYAVFFATESEAITYNYDLDLTGENVSPDPRIAHSFNTNIDDYGNVLQSLAVVYPRLNTFEDASLDSRTVALINQVQTQLQIAYSENHFTHAILPPDSLTPADRDTNGEFDHCLLPLPSEVRSYELTGLLPEPSNNNYLTLEQLQALRLSTVYQTDGIAVQEISYEQTADTSRLQKRIVEWSRVLYFNQDLTSPLALGELNPLALPYETYTLALTDQLLDAILGDKLTPAIRTDLQSEQKSGYLSTDELAASFADLAGSNQYWVRSGIAGFADDAADHFYLPEAYTDAFGNTTTLQYDTRDLYMQSSAAPAVNTSHGPVINTTSVQRFNYRVLAPEVMVDINGNSSEVVFDTLGNPVASAIKGKGDEGDNLEGFLSQTLDGTDDALLDLPFNERIRFFTEENFNTATALRFLGNATTRSVYDFGESRDADGEVVSYAQRPAGAAVIAREQHVASLNVGTSSPIQVAFQYSDAGGNVLVTKSQAEPAEGDGVLVDGALRWVANGKTVLNNKGKPVKQYEPYFSQREVGPDTFVPDHRFEEPQEIGVTPIIYYDSAGRVVRTELPDGTYSRAEFSAWHVVSYDPNDTVLEESNAWMQRMRAGSQEEQVAARIAEKHANTPASVFLDTLGREVVAVAHNRTPDLSSPEPNLLNREWLDEKQITYTKLDTEGKPLWLEDARQNLVMRYTVAASTSADPTKDFYPAYDIAGNLLFQHSMDAGDRWLINDATGQPFYAWDENERTSENGDSTYEFRIYRTHYDELRRPIKNELQINGGEWQATERMVYGEALEDQADARARNLKGQLYQHYDPSGVLTTEHIDFKGNLLAAKRQLTSAIKAEVINWPDPTPLGANAQINDLLETDVFTQSTQYDALNRMVEQKNWHLEGREPATYLPQYNQRGVLKSEELIAKGVQTQAIKNIVYDAKGQRQQLVLGNGTVTDYEYDSQTYRLIKLSTTKAGKIFQDLYYTYDAVGNITDIRDDAQQTIYFRNSVVEPEFKYIYDALYRLIEAKGREHATYINQQDNHLSINRTPIPSDDALQNYTETYQYDEVDNILNFNHQGDGAGVSGWNRFYQYALDSNRLLATSKSRRDFSGIAHYAESASANLSVPYRYDTHGSMLNLERTGSEFDLHWDYRDMIHHSTLEAGGGSHAFYNYDSQKQRTRKRIEKNNDNIIEERFYLGGMELYRRTKNGVLVEEIETYHLFATDDRVLIVENVLETDNVDLDAGVLFRYQYSNHLGSVGLELNANAEVISYEEYHPYGTTAYSAKNSAVKAVAKRYKYTGMERDEETGLAYHTARYYLPWLGRWGSSDPIGIEGGINLFLYAGGNPVNSFDLTGKQSQSDTELDASASDLNLTAQQQTQYRFNFPGSGLTAERMNRIIQNSGIPNSVKNMFRVEGNNLIVDSPTDSSTIPSSWAWIESVFRAGEQGIWDVVSATTRTIESEDRASTSQLTDIELPAGELGQWSREPVDGDEANRQISWLTVSTLPTHNGHELGLTVLPAGRTQNEEMSITYDPDGDGPEPERTRSLSPLDRNVGRRGNRGVLIIATALKHNSQEPDARNDLDILETFFHEAAAHAGLIAVAERSGHIPGPTNYSGDAAERPYARSPADMVALRVFRAFRALRQSQNQSE